MASGDVVPGPGDVHTPVILLVDDDVLVRFSTAEILRDEGHVVLEAVNASEALEIIETGHPLDLVLSDVRMPGQMDGLALTQVIRTLRPALPVVLVSSHLAPETPHVANAFLGKPYRVADLIAIVQQMIGPEWQAQQSSPSAS